MPFSPRWRLSTLLAPVLALAAPADSSAGPVHPQAAQDCCPVVELRQYTLHPGRRDELVSLFDAAFIEPQEAAGMRVIGQFRDLGDAQRFVWLRGFDGMEERKAALNRFYTGPVWQAQRERANATMVDSDNVLLLRPAFPGSGFTARRAMDDGAGSGVIVASIHYFAQDISVDKVRDACSLAAALAERAGARILAQYVSENSPNSFPRLPVRTGENVFVWFAAFPTRAAGERWQAGASSRATETLLLEPTARSRLR